MRRVGKDQKISGHEQKECGGYNRTRYILRGGRRATTIHSIHLRMRNLRKHSLLMSYRSLVQTMAHELAHCVHQDHSPAFWKLMREIQAEHAEFVRTGKLGEEESNGSTFNIYGSCTSTTYG
jgi:hypothetical protein